MRYTVIILSLISLAGCASTNDNSRPLDRSSIWNSPPKVTSIPSDLGNAIVAPEETPPVPITDGSMDNYITYAIQHNSGLRASFEIWVAAMEKIPQVTTLPDPQFSWMYFVEEVQTRTGPQQNRFTLSQKFPWFGKLKRQGETSAFAAESLWWKVEAKKLKIVRDVKNAYLEYAYLGRAVQILEENLALLRSLEPIVQRSIQVGGGQGPLIRLQVEIGKLENDLESLQGFQEPVNARLKSTMNMDGRDLLPWPILEEGSIQSLEHANVVKQLDRINPDLQSILQKINQAEVMTERARLDRYPDFSVGVTYIDTGSAVTATVPSDSGDDPWAFTIGFSLPIWRHKYDAGIREAQAIQRASSHQLRQKRFDLLSEIELKLYEVEDAARQVTLYQKTLIPRARQALEVTEVSYESGSSTFLDIIDAQRELLAFEKSYWRFVATHKQRIADIEMLIGGPLS